jgi:hypothetical protein
MLARMSLAMALLLAIAAPEGDAEPVATDPTPTEVASDPAPSVPEATWSALAGKRVAVDTPHGTVEGELTSSEGDHVVLIADDGTVNAVPKRDAKSVKVVGHKPAPAPAKKEEPAPKEAPAATAEDPPADDGTKKDDKKKREHALLGAFTAHGGAYANWRGDGVSSGGGAYLMDWGIGINATPGFGMYAMAGGVLGAKIDHKTVNANAGHFNLMFAFGGKYYHSMFGAGVALSRLKLESGVQKDAGLSLPFKIFGKLPLPHHLYLGIGLSYELMLIRDWHRFVNVIGGQIILGRW